MAENNVNIEIRNDFNQIFGIISYHRQSLCRLKWHKLVSQFVPFEMAQIPTILFSIGWTNHQIIMNRCKSDNERLFYILFAQKNNYRTSN